MCTAVNGQTNPDIVTDGNGGLIVVWQDYRLGSVHVYAQRFNGTGLRQWAVDGIPVGPATGAQQEPAAVSDGLGGAVVAWADFRSGTTSLTDIYAQDINSSGLPVWTSGGVAICTSPRDQTRPVIISDYLLVFGGGPGSIIAWESHVSGGEFDIYSQAINGSGAVRWAANGVPVCTIIGNQAGDNGRLVMCSDGTGLGTPKGSILGWSDERAPGPSDVYAQRLNGAGVQQWGLNGIPVVSNSAVQDQPSIVAVAAGSAIVVFRDLRNGNADIYARRMGTGGWAANGLPVCQASGAQSSPVAAYDGKGGVITAWADERNSTADDIFVQRVDASGAPKWAIDGLSLCNASGTQNNPQIVSDSHGGAIITWQDARLGSDRVLYAQRVDSTGTPLWDPNGVRVCFASGDESEHVLLSDPTGGAFVAWKDRRSGHDDIYATWITPSGPVSAVGDAAERALPRLQVSPNPTPGSTRIRFDLPGSARATARVHTLAGQLVCTLADDVEFPAGGGELRWDGRDARGRPVANGIYFVGLETRAGLVVQKVSVVR